MANEVEFAVTPDGWRIALHRYRPPPGIRRRHAVVCCHGLSCNHIAFDVHPDVSLARHLARRGYDVFSLDLRGHGVSDRPSLFGPRRFGWAFDDYLLSDVPAAIRRVVELAGCERIHWIGHSMGGLLLYAYLARGDGSAIRSGVTVGSALDYSASRSGFHGMTGLAGVLRAIPAVPIGAVAFASSPLVGRWSSPFERFNVWASNVEPRHWRTVCRKGFHAVSAPVMEQLASAMRPGGLTSRDGALAYIEGLARATAPVLAIAGDRDAQCPPDAARRTIEALGSPDKELAVFGPAGGHADHYGHFDLLMGLRAHTEVYPVIDRWLDAHDATA